ncbi:MAG: translation initiation factor IF-2, partial [Candidatus Firestonebacteria bacterium]
MKIIKKEKDDSKKKVIAGVKTVKTESARVSKAKTPKKTVAKVVVSKTEKTVKPRRKTAARKQEPLVSTDVQEIPQVSIAADAAAQVSVKAVVEKKEKINEAVKEEFKIKQEPAVKTPAEVTAKTTKEIEMVLPITVKDLSVKLQEKPSVLIKTLMNMKVMAGLNQLLDEQVVNNICGKYGVTIKKALDEEEMVLHMHKEDDSAQALLFRPAIVTLMGHVDHGKTSLLDAIRKSKVTESEHGGITQHIGAYRVVLPHGEITFLDTPGHEAFTAMRARGAGITDIVILVVAADDGIMPQTIEAVDHARAAGVSIIVAINKVDKPQVDINKVKKQLSELNLMAEDWGGKIITVPVSAKTGAGIDDLLEMVLLEAQMLELKANPKKLAKGVVIEAKISKGRGPVATLLVQNGTLHLNENIIVGNYYGKIRAMFDDHGHSVT